LAPLPVAPDVTKAIEIEDLEARVTDLDRAAETRRAAGRTNRSLTRKRAIAVAAPKTPEPR
jgi:hypothetical protein